MQSSPFASSTRPGETGQPNAFRVPRWPFYLGDVIIVGTALFLLIARSPLSTQQVAACVLSVLAGALLPILPHWWEYTAFLRVQNREAEAARADTARALAFALRQNDEISKRLESLLARADLVAGRLESIPALEAPPTPDPRQTNLDLPDPPRQPVAPAPFADKARGGLLGKALSMAQGASSSKMVSRLIEGHAARTAHLPSNQVPPAPASLPPA